MTRTIRVLIADDHTIMREGIRLLLETEPGFEVVGEAADGAEACRKVLELKPDVVLMDLIMPIKDGIEATREIRAKAPEVPILVLTSAAEEEKIFPAIRAGALGYLLKDTHPQELIKALRTVCQGQISLSPEITQKLVGEIKQPDNLRLPFSEILTVREIDVLRLVAKGFSNQEIADELRLSSRTIGAHISNVLSKLNLNSRTQAALYALRKGITGLDSEKDSENETAPSES